MAVVGIERRPDGVMVIHTAAPEGELPRMLEASDAATLWHALHEVLNDPTLPQVSMEAPQTVSLEQALGAMAGDLLGTFLRDRVPAAAPHIQRAASHVTQKAARKASGLASMLGKADINVPRYPRGS